MTSMFIDQFMALNEHISSVLLCVLDFILLYLEYTNNRATITTVQEVT